MGGISFHELGAAIGRSFVGGISFHELGTAIGRSFVDFFFFFMWGGLLFMNWAQLVGEVLWGRLLLWIGHSYWAWGFIHVMNWVQFCGFFFMNWSQLCGGEVFLLFLIFDEWTLSLWGRFSFLFLFECTSTIGHSFFFYCSLVSSRSHALALSSVSHILLSHFVNFYCVSSRSHALALSSVSRILIIFTAAWYPRALSHELGAALWGRVFFCFFFVVFVWMHVNHWSQFFSGGEGACPLPPSAVFGLHWLVFFVFFWIVPCFILATKWM